MSVSRRDFIKTTGALVVSFGAASICGPSVLAQGPFDTHRSHIDPEKLDSWIAVGGDGTVTAYAESVTSAKACSRRKRNSWQKSFAYHCTA
jgi:hypothetical protein